MAKPWENFTSADLRLSADDLPKFRRKRRKSDKPRTEAQKRGPKRLPPELKRQRIAVSLRPDVIASLKRARIDRITGDKSGSDSQIIELALLEYFGKRLDRKAEVVLNHFGQRAARVLSLYARDGIMAQVYRVLDDLAKAVGEDWSADDFTPAPDEMTRLYAENRMMRDALRQAYRTTDAEVEAWLNRRHLSAGPEDLRDGLLKPAPRYLRPAAELEDDDDGRNSMGLRLRSEPFMG